MIRLAPPCVVEGAVPPVTNRNRMARSTGVPRRRDALYFNLLAPILVDRAQRSRTFAPKGNRKTCSARLSNQHADRIKCDCLVEKCYSADLHNRPDRRQYDPIAQTVWQA